jgi:16S rRNA (adenine1518-N6/adenine1519-N6)-dimethyltransferase
MAKYRGKVKAAKRRRAGAPQHRRKGAKLGQHFLTARWASALLVESARVEATSTVLEIGPGTGNLTKELLRTGCHVIAVEKDSSLVETLRVRFAQEIATQQLTIVEQDIRNVTPESLNLSPGSYILAANIPYYITGEIIKTFLTSPAHPARAALLVQREVAERIARDKKESILSLSVKVYGNPVYVQTVSKGCFSPPPRVDSAILLIDSISHERIMNVGEEHFFLIVKKGFSGKRKMIGGNLKGLLTTAELAACGVAPQHRAENIPLETWLCLAKHRKKA